MSETPQSRADARLRRLTREWEDSALAETEKERSASVIADMVLRPETGAAMIASNFHSLQGLVGEGGKTLELGVLKRDVELMAARVGAGDLSDMESLLVAQAVSLHVMFTRMSLLASVAKADQQMRELLTLAMKVQSNCRATISAIGDLKFPRQVTFAKQANIAHGPQQVNQHVTSGVAGATTQPAALTHEPSPDLGTFGTVRVADDTPVAARARARKKAKPTTQNIRGRK